MIPTYSDYIRRYVRRSASGRPSAPGEHHFVATYLVPVLFRLDGIVPDYVNPDGTKGVLGDVVYYKDERHHFSIEVKLGTIRLTKGEFNAGIVNTNPDRWPSIFLGVGLEGIAICPWREFRVSYIASVVQKRPGWMPVEIADGYGPVKQVDALSAHLKSDAWYSVADGELEKQQEGRFLSALREYRDVA